ncbi:DUF4870 domain-containing protein [Urechidicola croceus]|uniref:Import component protein n=1 Tax=Urechidicola croceus TaxID=1850246 RepID=A0A1D8P4B8_9FLAO|nr:hypothetical protein [Urechidicola croceus]AOW19397.1 hypothetical protein LPB138_01280 [Urechidicola croceus]
MENTTINEGKTTAIISYFWLIGLVIAFIMNANKKNSFASFHIRQMVGLTLLSILNGWIVGKFFGTMAAGIVGFGLFVLWIIGFIGAIQGEEKKIPLLGDQFQEWFRNM